MGDYGLSGDLPFDVLDRLDPLRDEVENGQFVLEGETPPIDAVDGRGSFADIVVYGQSVHGVESEDGTPFMKNTILYSGKAAVYDDQQIVTTAGKTRERTSQSTTGPVKKTKLRIMWLWNTTLPNTVTVHLTTNTESLVIYRSTSVWYNGYRAEIEMELAQ